MKKSLVIGCLGGRHIGRSLAKISGSEYSNLITERFPDSEIKIRLPVNVKGKNVYFVQSFYEDGDTDINDKFVEVIFAANTALELGAKNVFLVAPYLSYLREDKRFEKGEAISAKILAKLCKIFKKVYVVEPHLHRFNKFSEFFPNAQRIKLDDEFADYVRKNIRGNVLLVGPDIESEQWVEPVAKKLGCDYVILKKKRFSPRKVKVSGKKVFADNIVVIDDIISTGRTMIEASKNFKAKKVYFFGAHGLFSDNSISELKGKAEVVVSNTIPSDRSKIDCSRAIAEIIK